MYPYRKKLEIPSDMMTASESGVDPNISSQGDLVQIKRVAKERKLSKEKVRALVDSKINLPAIMGTATVNVLELNIALDELK